MLKNIFVVAILSISTFAASAWADDAARAEAKQTIEMKDGSKLYVFKDGKMSMEDKRGKASRMKKGTVMETKDGQKIIMHGDEVMRLERLLEKDHKGG